MSAGRRNSGSYSASVRLFLRRGSEQIALAQVGSDRLYFDTPVLLPAGPAQVIVEIDGEPRARSVRLAEQSEPACVLAYLPA